MLVPIFFNTEKYLQHSMQLILDYEMCFDIVSFVGHNSPYISSGNIITQALPLQDSACLIFLVFSDNQMWENTTACLNVHVLR